MDKVKPDVRVINLAQAPGEKSVWGRPASVVYLWGIVEFFIVTNPLQISSKLRVWALRTFGAEIGNGVVFRPRTRVKFPWKLSIGDRCWIGEGVWIHNQDEVWIGTDVVVSQEAFITTGSHALRRDMALLTRPVKIEDGVWITSRSMILGGTTIGRSSVVKPGSVLGPNASIPANRIVGTSNKTTDYGERYYSK
ncbi:DapH/DapD/GlmU-related protein [Paeniglutamicibacter psychrophenolicus]|uniref:DapH/DapD/GlmU-related protein n=1 Tax=Paeniglutamicibacter psychrophenolicus TaxID=257454 RepID=UPI0027D85808|nr:DapH/DapD/GlmU-related protein [Paeniglutamicibacter psychrophenolicus]